ncbi:MAG: succinyl-CoA--3-ketoacid-CoA transferase, partial [Actinomycetia bacterium]|nr:succinyl-CoA--3-ketoacid-CoA transferase [Actinomycetes bacterium]
GVKAVYVITRHCTRDGTPKLVERCSYPLTGAGVVNRIYTDLAVIDVTADGFGVTEVSPGISLAEVAAHTAAPLLDRRSGAIPSSAAAP